MRQTATHKQTPKSSLSTRTNKRHGNAFLNSVTDKIMPYLIAIIVIHQMWLGRWRAYYKWMFLYIILTGLMAFFVLRRLWKETMVENKNWAIVVASVITFIWVVLLLGTVIGQLWIENDPPLFMEISFISLGTLYFMAISMVLCDIGDKMVSTCIKKGKTPSKTHRRTKNIIIAVLTLTLTIISLIGNSPSVVDVEINIPHLPVAADGFTIVQISDLHIGAVVGLSYLESIIDTIIQLKPDILVMTGNIFDYRYSYYYEPQADVFKKLTQPTNKPPNGIFFVPGSSEHFGGGTRTWLGLLESYEIIDLRNGYVPIAKNNETLFYMAGTDDWHSRYFYESRSVSDVTLLKPHLNVQFPNILLSNSPSYFYDAKSIGIDLQLSGRTMGGQVFPMHFLVYFFYPYFSGLYEEGKSAIYVSQGTGFWGPPMRLLSKSEITRVTLRAREKMTKNNKDDL
eukprot:TRINITY_DN13404_c0_g1_i1.p1 TRINITY_DN13404_c0_g1~~TRINITY_DN13404_c0_g1_i1.p1  ORF type:complete len:454 (+),score=53.07 TRINITY_DN13404_c0_g1_i1:76-1437(+)